jgi:hypothetical protein
MGRLGFEPRTNQLKAEYSTVELTTHVFFCTDDIYNMLSLIDASKSQKIVPTSLRKSQTSAMVEKIHFLTI